MVPFRLDFVGLLGCVFIAMIVGFLDDRSDGGWSEYRLGAIDMGLAFFATWMVLNLQGSTIWLPLLKDPVQIPVSLYLLGGTLLIWVSINATNCTDGGWLVRQSLEHGNSFLGSDFIRRCRPCSNIRLPVITALPPWRRLVYYCLHYGGLFGRIPLAQQFS